METVAIIGQSTERAKDKVYEMTMFDPQNGKVWNDAFATSEQTEAAAWKYAQKFFPDCGVVPARLTRTKGWFWLGAATGFAIACVLAAVAVAYFLPKII